jgi:regulator of protease activity HflC (stomatin/prohibitin superfamily)
MGFEWLGEWLGKILELFRFFYVIRDWESGITLRFGHWRGKVMKPGLHFILPFAIDEVHTIRIIPTVTELDPQTIVTKDKVVIVTQALVKYQVDKPEVCLIDVDNEADAVKEFTQGAIHTVIADTDYSTASVKEIEKRAKEQAQKEVDKWGIKIKSVVLKSFGKMSSIRLLNSK